MPLEQAKKQVGSFWSYLYPKKEDIQNQLIDVMPEISANDISATTEEIKAMASSVSKNKTTWQEWFDILPEGKKHLAHLGQQMEGQIITTEGVIKANQQARASALAHNEAIKAQTFSAKAGKVALQALATAGNMLAMWGITKGLELAVKGIDNLVHSAEHCKERVDEVMSSYQSTTSTLRENAKEIASLSSRYDQLSKGVGNLGNNISLTEDEFEEYHNITSKIAEMYPDLVDGWDAQGNAIVNLTDSAKELNAEYEKSLHNANLTLMESKDDIFKNYENTVNDITKQIEYAEKAMDIVQSKGSFYDVIYDSEGHKTSYYKAFENLGLSVDDMINGNFSTLERQLVLKIQSLKDEMDKAAQDVTPLLNAYLSEDVDYQNLSDEKLKTALSTFISSLPETLVTDITENGASAGSGFVEGFVDAVKDDDSVQNALIQLLSLDTEELSYEEAKAMIDNYISIIVNALNSIGYDIDPIELQVELGLDIKNVKEDLRTRLSNGTQDLVVDDWIDTLTVDEAKLANSTAFDEALERQKQNLDNAALSAENYSAALEEVKAQQDNMGNETGISPLSISETIDQLNTRLKPAFDSLKSAYQDIFDDDGEFQINSIDILSTCGTIKSTLDELNKIEGITVDYSSFEDFVRVLNNTESTEQDVETAFDSLATSISRAALSGAEDFETMKTALEDLGVVNSEMVAFDELTNNIELLEAAIKQANLTMDKFVINTDDGKLVASEAAMAFLEEMVGTENCAQALALLQLKQVLINQSTITTADDCQNILDLATAANVGIVKLQQLQTLMDMIARRDAAVASGDSRAVSELNRAIHEFSANAVNNLKLDDIEVDFGSIGGGASSAAKAGAAAASSYTDAFEEDLQSLDSLRDRGVIDEKEYLTRLRALYERYFKDKTQYAEQYAKYERQYLDGMKSLYDSALSGVSKLMSHQIDGYTEAKEAAVASLEAEKEARLEAIEAQKEQLEAEQDIIDKRIDAKQELIDGIQKEIDAMKDARAERQRQLDLQKAQYELESMKNQRTILLYSREKGMHYVADDSAVRDAQEKVEDAEFDIEVSQKEKEIKLIEQEIDLLEEQKEAIQEQIDALDGQAERIEEYYSKMIAETEKYYDSLISNTEKQKSKWEELAEVEEIAQAYSAMKQVFGDMGYTVQDILNGNEQAFEDFKSKYVSLLSDMNNNANFAEGLSYATGISEENLGSFLDKTKAVGTGIDELSSKSSSLGIVAEGMDGIATSATNANTRIAEAVANVGNVAANVGDLSTSLSTINTLVTDELTAFDTLKQTINDVIEAINQKTQALQNGQAVAGVAITTGIGYFILLKEKILELQECISNINLAVMTLDRTPIDNLTDAFRHLYDQILLVSTTLGGGGQETGALGSITSAIQALNGISLEKGIIAQLANLKTAIDGVASAIGGGGESSGSEVLGKSASLPVGNSDGKGSGGEGGGNSLTAAISQMGDTAKKVIGDPDAEGDGTVIGEFGSMKTAVTDVTSSIGNGDSEGAEEHIEDPDDEGDGNLINSIISLGDKTKEVLGEPGGDGVIGRFEQFKQPISDADNHVQSIARGLEDIDGQQVECTIKIHVESDGSLPGGGILNTTMHTESGEYTADYGSTHPTKQTTGTITTSSGLKLQPIRPGDSAWALQEAFAPLLQEMQHHLVASAMYEQRRQTEQTLRDITAANMVYNSRHIQPAIHGGVHITCPGVTSQEVARQVGAELNHMFNGLHNYADQQSSIR